MKQTSPSDLSVTFLRYLEILSWHRQPLLAATIEEQINFVEQVRQEGFIVPANQSIEQVVHRAVTFVNSRLPERVRIVGYQTGYFVCATTCLAFPE